MADRSRGAARVTSLADMARTLIGGRARPAASGADGAPVALADAPRRLISDPAAFFGAGEPLPPVAPAGTPPRAFDYPTFYNTGARPRSTEPVTFAQLRQLADTHDLTRLAIETRKDQMERVDWRLVKRDGTEGDPPAQMVEFFRRPDRDHDWGTWLRMVLEEMFVTDATSLYLRRTRGGGLYAVEQLDGATIVPLLDDTGRRPLPPLEAYQQHVKGMPVVAFSREELLYAPRNPRVHKVYGYSPVEQILVTVNLALRRQAHQLNYYDASNIPAALVAVPKEWSATQIEQFQKWWDIMSTAEAGLHSSMKFVPGDVKAQMLQTEALFGDAEEWLARLVCWAFSLPPTALVKMNNRATAETVQDAAQDEGLAPLMRWVKGVMDPIIQAPEGLGMAQWEWQWKTERPLEPTTQAAIDVQYIGAGVRTAKAVAMERFGTYEEPPAPEPVDPNAPPKQDDAPPADGEAAKAAGRALRRDARWY